MAASQIDILAPFDPTAYATISGAQLLQLISGATPYTDKGFNVSTEDVAGIPVVPNANVTTKWQNYLWIRQSAASVSVYVWSSNADDDATYLKWISVNIAGIAVGSITGAMIADNTIPDIKIININWSKLTGVPTSFTPGGAAGGDLTGIYPNPSVATDAITTTKIADLNVTGSKLEAGSTTTGIPVNKMQSSGVAGAVLQDTGATGAWTVPKLIYNLANPTSGADQGKLVAVKTPYTDGYELISPSIFLKVYRSPAYVNFTASSKVIDVVHGLGGVPDAVTCKIRCKAGSGGDAGYSELDIISPFDVANDIDGTDNVYPAVIVGANATNVYVTIGSGAVNFFTLNKGTGVVGVLTPAKWEVMVIAVIYP